jgi:hypothetical protein
MKADKSIFQKYNIIERLVILRGTQYLEVHRIQAVTQALVSIREGILQSVPLKNIPAGSVLHINIKFVCRTHGFLLVEEVL